MAEEEEPAAEVCPTTAVLSVAEVPTAVDSAAAVLSMAEVPPAEDLTAALASGIED